ncbi:MAG: dihydropteroate synthase [Alistipes sp.]|jgi:dihydropteroate synthase|nr:dihydropteroate synthase [Alistipes sp.]
MKVGEQTLDLSRPVAMTIVNVTPDSFFAGSRSMHIDEITMRVEEAVGWGAKIIDVGGYSSRPGAEDVSVDEEVDRVMTGVEVVRAKAPGVVVSLDTFRSEVAAKVIKRFGACIINDISGGQIDPEIFDVAAKFRVPYILMHMRGTPKTMQEMTDYQDIVADVKDFFAEKIEFLRSRGVDDIILDPGFGFAKTTPQNFRLLAQLRQLQKFELPILAGISRKSMIYNVLESTPVEALSGTAALNWACLQGGANILRVHDTLAAVEVIKLHNYYKNVNG